MKESIVVIGIGQMGAVFANGFLRAGHPVYPVTRETDMDQAAAEYPSPALVLLAVAEGDLHPTLSGMPAAWRDRLGLLQNELLPGDWQRHGIERPTVASVWFEKKKGQDSKVIIPTPIFGPRATSLETALSSLGIASVIVRDEAALLFELVRKNLYILTSNIAGLRTGGTVGELWSRHEDFARQVASDVLDIQANLTGLELDREPLIQAMKTAFDGDPEHKCMGRSAPARLERALRIADEAGLEVATLRGIAHEGH